MKGFGILRANPIASQGFKDLEFANCEKRVLNVEVKVRDNQVDKALKVLKRKMQTEGIFRELRAREHYEKPSEVKRRRKNDAVRRHRKELRKEAEREGLLSGSRR